MKAMREAQQVPPVGRLRRRDAPILEVFRSHLPALVWSAIALLISLVLGFAAMRVVTDWPHILAGTVPDADSFEFRYVVNPALSYGHIGLGVVYLLLAPLQLWRAFRVRHFGAHRRIGRIALVAGLGAGVLAVVAGTLFPFGGLAEAIVAILFGHYFGVCLSVAFLAIRRGDAATHRRWMIRAFAVALGVGTIRIWAGILMLAGATPQTSLALGFCVALPLHALVAEIYLRRCPLPRWSGADSRVRR